MATPSGGRPRRAPSTPPPSFVAAGSGGDGSGDGSGSGGSGGGGGGGDSDSPGGNGSSPGGDGDRPRTQSSGSDEVRAAPQLQDEARKEHRRKKRDSRAFALWRRLYRRRWLRQYVENGTLVREGSTRVIGTDELFMDLIVVSCTSAVGQVLRKAPNPGYRDVEKFALLFASVWGIWRDAGWLWNMFSSCGDLTEKLVVYLAMAALCGVGVSAPLAFTSDEAARGVGFSAFASSVFLGLSFVLYGWHEPILNHRSNLWNYATGYGLCIILTAIPYLLAGAVGSPNVRRALFWVAIGTVQSRLVWYPVLFRQVHKLYHRDPALPSVNVESLAEKAQLLTLIVLGESMLVLLLEGAAVLSDGADLGRIMIILALGTLITYSYHSVYFDLDKPVLPQGHHALRYKVWTGMAWILGHLLYHMSLVLAAASLGWVVRGAALRTADGEADPFLRAERIIFSCSWAAVYCLSAGLSALHDGGPRAVTKLPRLVTRVVLATTLAVVLPLKRDRLSALDVLIITTCISRLIVIVEVVLNETDRLRWWVKVPAELKKKAEDAQRGSDASGEEGVGHAGNTAAGTESGSSSSDGSSDEEEDVEKGKPRRGRCSGEDGCWSWRRRVTPPLGSVSVRAEADPPGVGSSGVSADSLDAPARSRARVSRGRHSFDRREERRRQRQYEKADQAGGFSLSFVG
ncbi:hypothetical protein I4F81_004565 [Pyropia yezoensis]|uniref:Uncharacterized protein n=1 Tax=Pyropia yezoensis TaxID=2788 RepID=A0ACC3BVN4_PYRYE|nr:hypothetical protein I4F81_004565 [Neopyropia yezoensis]